jgi:antitoxin (DNA-binding transcriptional repressor) of toxin-antitoxin stability system
MNQVTIREAQRDLSKLISLVQQGEEVVIEEGGEAVAYLIPPPAFKKKRIPGRDQGRFTVPEDFDDPLPSEILDSFEQ